LKLLVDTNVLMKALIKDSLVRATLLNPANDYYIPEYAFEEIGKHIDTLEKKTGLGEEEIRLFLGILATNLRVVPKEEVLGRWSEAESIMGSVDRDDTPFVAAALASSCEAIWSDDKDFKRQNRLRILNTREVLAGTRTRTEG